MKKTLMFAAAAIIVVVGARRHHSQGIASMALSPVEKQSLHDAPNDAQESVEDLQSRLGMIAKKDHMTFLFYKPRALKGLFSKVGNLMTDIVDLPGLRKIFEFGYNGAGWDASASIDDAVLRLGLNKIGTEEVAERISKGKTIWIIGVGNQPESPYIDSITGIEQFRAYANENWAAP